MIGEAGGPVMKLRERAVENDVVMLAGVTVPEIMSTASSQEI